MDNILKVVQILPEYIALLYPGYITIYLYYFFLGRHIKDSQWLFGKSICISYLYTVICSQVVLKFQLPDSLFLNNFLLLVLGVIGGVGTAKLRESEWFMKVLAWLQGSNTYALDEFEVIRDSDRSAWVCIYLKECDFVYEGSLRESEIESVENKYICLSGFYKYKLNKKGKPIEPYIEDHEGNNNEKVIIHYNDILLIEKRNTD